MAGREGGGSWSCRRRPGQVEFSAPDPFPSSFANASGKVAAFDIGILSREGSPDPTRPALLTYTATRADLEATAREVVEVVGEVEVKVEIRHTYPLAEAVRAHRDLEGREAVGSIVMVSLSISRDRRHPTGPRRAGNPRRTLEETLTPAEPSATINTSEPS